MEKEKKRGRDIENKELEEPVEEGAVGIFKKSKKIIRSPEQRIAEKERNKKQQQPCVSSENRENRENSESMEELKELMKQIIRDMAQNTSDLKEEIREIKQEMKNKEERWELEKHQLMERVEILENKLEIGEKLKRKNNIVLKGVRITEGAERQEVENFLATKLQIPTRIEKARVLNNDKRFPIVVAEVGTYDEKQKIMRGKNKLKGTTIYIDNDLTREERYIQKELRNIAKEERGKGKSVKIKYQKLLIKGKVYKWNRQVNGGQLVEPLRTESKN